jgi:hypothetical protein
MTHIVKQGDVFKSTTVLGTQPYIFARMSLEHSTLMSLSGNRYTDDNLEYCLQQPIEVLNKATNQIWEFVGRFDNE